MIVPIVLAFVFALSFVGVVRDLSTLGGWSATFDGRGTFTTSQCETTTGRFITEVTCEGELRPERTNRPVDSVLLGTRGGVGSDALVPGGTVEVFFDRALPERAYPEDAWTSEIGRIILRVFPLMFVAGGAFAWLVGWVVNRKLPPDEAEKRSHRYAYPQRFLLQSRGLTWMTFGVLWWLADRWVVTALLGMSNVG